MSVLDTNVLSEPRKQHPGEHVLAWLASLDEEAGVISISVGELLTGVRALPAGRRRAGLLEAIDSTLRSFAGSVLAYDEAAARHSARLQEVRRAGGRPVAVEDGMIAAICVARGTRLTTRNTSDFAGLGLELVDPWAASS